MRLHSGNDASVGSSSSSYGGSSKKTDGAMLAVVVLSHHRVSSSKTIIQAIPRGSRCVEHVEITWSAV